MSREFHLLTRERPRTDVFVAALREATGDGDGLDVGGDFEDPDSYLNVSGQGLWIEIEPPGHVEVVELADSYPDEVTLPEPDREQCLWLAVASVPAGAPEPSADVAWRVFRDLATYYDGIAIEP